MYIYIYIYIYIYKSDYKTSFPRSAVTILVTQKKRNTTQFGKKHIDFSKEFDDF